jgi:hypothetical protein
VDYTSAIAEEEETNVAKDQAGIRNKDNATCMLSEAVTILHCIWEMPD